MKTYLLNSAIIAIVLSASLSAQEIDHPEAAGGPSNLVKIKADKKEPRHLAVYSVGDTPPVITDFYWGNQGTCVANTNPSGTITMFHPGAPGLAFNWCMIVKPLPPPPYTIIYGVRGHIFGKAASLASVLYDVYTGKFSVYSIGASDSGAAAQAAWRMNSFTSYIGSPAGIIYNYTNAMATGGLLGEYVRIRDNGTTRTIATSKDKEVWLTISAVPSSDHATPNFFGYALRGTGDSMASLMTIYHETITTP